MQILTETKGVSYKYENSAHIFDLGTITYNGSAIVVVQIQGSNLTNFKANKTCGCLIADPTTVTEDLIKLPITYKNTHIKGNFTRSVIIEFKENGVNKRETVKIKGTVK